MAESNGDLKSALQYADQHFDRFKETLITLSRIPSISAEGFPPAEVRRSAEAMGDALRDAGVEKVQILEIPDVHPYVYGEWMHRAGAPNWAAANNRYGCAAVPSPRSIWETRMSI